MFAPLVQLADAVADGKPPPFEWVIEHAPRGELGAVWKAAPRGDVVGLVPALFVLSAAMHGVDGIRQAALGAARSFFLRSGWGEYNTARRALLDVVLVRGEVSPSLREAHQAMARIGSVELLPVVNLLYFAWAFPEVGLQHRYVYNFEEYLKRADARVFHARAAGAERELDAYSRRTARGIVRAVQPTSLAALLAGAERNRKLL